jgi:hypothetical protein
VQVMGLTKSKHRSNAVFLYLKFDEICSPNLGTEQNQSIRHMVCYAYSMSGILWEALGLAGS